MLYMNCVCVLKGCFKEINNNLLHVLIVNNKPCVLTMFYYEKRNPFLIMKLKALMKKHMAISNAVQMLNMTLSVQFLASIVITFFDVSLNTYFYLVQWHGELVFNLDKQVGDIYLLFILYYIIKMAFIVWACETGKNQAQEIHTTIHYVLNSIRDEKMKNELQLFSLQTLHCKITFSAIGFNVDATFLATMVGTIATYMLISVQFLVISHSCDEKSAINST
ncbi:PREDICTED: putative gustatory receptor 28b [Wasmannia auropunctata]|uniref:putative gustatory receptor 28b n=1 Tax=Wasmannia auropunctata TaxID=64793 RepID=UPI0005F031B1|nr:PREDICTED: putative gustatory receptor 28b [Wasmannia auropunctata]